MKKRSKTTTGMVVNEKGNTVVMIDCRGNGESREFYFDIRDLNRENKFRMIEEIDNSATIFTRNKTLEEYMESGDIYNIYFACLYMTYRDKYGEASEQAQRAYTIGMYICNGDYDKYIKRFEEE